MKKNDLLANGKTIYRILSVGDKECLVIDCTKKSAPKWVQSSLLSTFDVCSEDRLPCLVDKNEVSKRSIMTAHQRFTHISSVLPFIEDKNKRCEQVSSISKETGISKQTINYYLWRYLAYQDILALAPNDEKTPKELTQDEKNMRWALNKYYYTSRKCSLTNAYTMMLKQKYCHNGVLIDNHPSFHRFRYYYRKHRKMQTYYISRNGLSEYQRNRRPLLGNGIQEYAPAIGTGMLDATICDIYLVNNAGELVGRPMLTACIDAYSSLCCGYCLTWEGGVYSLRNLMANIISDKRQWCRRFGIDITTNSWNCNKLPAKMVTDMGREYVSDTFSQIADLGVTVVNLPPYRPELKGAVEKFFDILQNLYKPLLKGKGVIEPDFQERGAHDYRLDACLTLKDFEKIILNCIIFYNSKRIIKDFPYTEAMLADKIEPYASSFWNYGLRQTSANLISVEYKQLMLTLLPRTTGKFSRKGLSVNGLRYKNDALTEKYLSCKTAIVAYNPENVSAVWLIEQGEYIPFDLIDSRFSELPMEAVKKQKASQKTIENFFREEALQAKIELADHIEVIAQNATKNGSAAITSIRTNRKKEKLLRHTDYITNKEENNDE